MAGTILITGASTGLGKEMALYLAERGFNMYATVRDLAHADTLHDAADSRNVQLRVLQLDVTSKASIDAAVQTVLNESGAIDGVINNAGIGLRGYFEDLAEQEIRDVFDANLFGVMAVTKAVLPHMREAGRGRIILISSVGGKIGSVGVSAYCATKFALEGFGESLSLEVAPLGVKVVLVEPGIVKTERWTTNRGIARGAKDASSPYCDWFQQSESASDDLVRRSTATAEDVAEVVHRALTAERPKLRYMVGWKARLLTALRKYLPGELFETLYFGLVVRRVTRTGRLQNAQR